MVVTTRTAGNRAAGMAPIASSEAAQHPRTPSPQQPLQYVILRRHQPAPNESGQSHWTATARPVPQCQVPTSTPCQVVPPVLALGVRPVQEHAAPVPKLSWGENRAYRVFQLPKAQWSGRFSPTVNCHHRFQTAPQYLRQSALNRS